MGKAELEKGLIAGGVAGGITAVLATLLLSRPVLAAPETPEDSKEALDYLIKLGELQAQALARLVEIAEMYPGVPGLPTVADPRLRKILLAQFMTDPDAACSLINGGEPNLVRGAPLALNILLAPGATTTLVTALSTGYVHIFTSADLYTDVPFAVIATILMDGHLWYFDTGLCPYIAKWNNWKEAASQWQVTLVNNSIFNVNIHAIFGGWDVEAQTFNKIMSVVKPISAELAQYGSPEVVE